MTLLTVLSSLPPPGERVYYDAVIESATVADVIVPGQYIATQTKIDGTTAADWSVGNDITDRSIVDGAVAADSFVFNDVTDLSIVDGTVADDVDSTGNIELFEDVIEELTLTDEATLGSELIEESLALTDQATVTVTRTATVIDGSTLVDVQPLAGKVVSESVVDGSNLSDISEANYWYVDQLTDGASVSDNVLPVAVSTSLVDGATVSDVPSSTTVRATSIIENTTASSVESAGFIHNFLVSEDLAAAEDIQTETLKAAQITDGAPVSDEVQVHSIFGQSINEVTSAAEVINAFKVSTVEVLEDATVIESNIVVTSITATEDALAADTVDVFKVAAVLVNETTAATDFPELLFDIEYESLIEGVVAEDIVTASYLERVVDGTTALDTLTGFKLTADSVLEGQAASDDNTTFKVASVAVEEVNSVEDLFGGFSTADRLATEPLENTETQQVTAIVNVSVTESAVVDDILTAHSVTSRTVNELTNVQESNIYVKESNRSVTEEFKVREQVANGDIFDSATNEEQVATDVTIGRKIFVAEVLEDLAVTDDATGFRKSTETVFEYVTVDDISSTKVTLTPLLVLESSSAQDITTGVKYFEAYVLEILDSDCFVDHLEPNEDYMVMFRGIPDTVTRARPIQDFVPLKRVFQRDVDYNRPASKSTVTVVPRSKHVYARYIDDTTVTVPVDNKYIRVRNMNKIIKV